MGGPEGPRTGIERPPPPKVKSWWESKQGDTEPRVVIGTKVSKGGEKLVRLVSRQTLKQTQGFPESAVAQSEVVPLSEFRSRYEQLKKAPKGVAPELVDGAVAAFEAQYGAETKVEPEGTPASGEAERVQDAWGRPEYAPKELCPVDVDVTTPWYAENADLFFEKDGKPAVPRAVVELFSRRNGLFDKVDESQVSRIMAGSISLSELKVAGYDNIRQLYRDEKLQREGGSNVNPASKKQTEEAKPKDEQKVPPTEVPKDAERPISSEASKRLGQANARLANIERTFADAESGRDGTPIFESEGIDELRGVLVEAQEMMRQMAGITDPAESESALENLIKKTHLFDGVYTRLLRQGIKPANKADAEPGPHPSGIPQQEEAPLKRGKEAADAQPPERQAMLDAEKAYLEKYKEFIKTKKFREKEPPELVSLRQAYGAARSAYKESLDSLKYERLNDQRYTDDEIRERVKARLDRVTDPDEREKLLAYYKNPDQYRYEVSMRYDRVVRYRELFSDHARRKIDARFDALDERKKNIFVKAASWVGNQNAKLEAWAGSKTKARVVRAVASTVLVGAVAGAAGALGTMSALAFAGWGTWRIGRVLAASTAGSVIGTGIANAGDAAFQWDARKRSDVTRQQRATGNLSDRDLEMISARQESVSSTMDPRVRQKRKQIIAALTGLGVGMEIATLAALVPGAESVADSQPDEQRGRDATPAENRQTLRESVNEVERTTQTNIPAATEQAGSPRPSQPAPTEQSRTTTPAPEESRAGTQGPEATDGVAMIERGEGANSMFYELQRELEARYPDPANRPVAVTRLLGESSAEGWSQALGFFRVENGEVISRIMHEGDTLTVNDNGELIFHDAFANNGQGADYRLMDSRGQFNGDAIRQVEQGIPQPEPVVAPPAPITPETEESVAPVPEIYSPEAASMPTPAIPDAAPMQAPTETQSAPPAHSSGPIPTLDQWVAEQRGAGVQSGEMPTAPDTAPQAPITEPVPAPVPEPINPGNTAIQSLDDYVREHTPVPETSPESTSGVLGPDTPLAAEPSAYLMSSNSNEVFVHGAGSPEQNLELAKEYLRTHPTARVYFDNPKEKWLGFSYTPRVASVELDQNGNLIKMDEALDDRGRALASVRDRLVRRIA